MNHGGGDRSFCLFSVIQHLILSFSLMAETVGTHVPHARLLDLESPWRTLPVDHFTGQWSDEEVSLQPQWFIAKAVSHYGAVSLIPLLTPRQPVRTAPKWAHLSSPASHSYPPASERTSGLTNNFMGFFLKCGLILQSPCSLSTVLKR